MFRSELNFTNLLSAFETLRPPNGAKSTIIWHKSDHYRYRARISPAIDNEKKNLLTAISHTFGERHLVNFGSLNTKLKDDRPTKINFLKGHILAFTGC